MSTMKMVIDFLMIVFIEVDQIEMLMNANQLMKYRLNREKLEERDIGAFYLVMKMENSAQIRYYPLNLIAFQNVRHG